MYYCGSHDPHIALECHLFFLLIRQCSFLQSCCPTSLRHDVKYSKVHCENTILHCETNHVALWDMSTYIVNYTTLNCEKTTNYILNHITNYIIKHSQRHGGEHQITFKQIQILITLFYVELKLIKHKIQAIFRTI